MIKTLHFVDFDGTLIDSPEPETGKQIWKEKTGQEYPHIGWWGRIESLNTDVFNIKSFPKIKELVNKEYKNPKSKVFILTSRINKVKSEVENVLNLNDINVNGIDFKQGGADKGVRVLRYLEQYPDVREINVYDDRDNEIQVFLNLMPKIPTNIIFNIYRATNGELDLVKSNNDLSNIINETIKSFIFI